MKRILVTGVSGFVAGHVALELLKRGYSVRGTVRDLNKAKLSQQTLTAHGADVSKLAFSELELEDDDGWAEAMRDICAVIHTASPFPMDEPDDKMALVPAARDGTLRVLRHARVAGIAKVVMTSSTVAVTNNLHKPKGFVFNESNWSNTEGNNIRAYAVSKTLAEQAAWDDVKKHGGPDLVVINPSFVVGPMLNVSLGTSATLIKQFFEGKFPAVPELCFGVVDVRDVAIAHVNAMEREEANGKRFIAAGGTRLMMEIVSALKSEFPEKSKKLPKFQAPKLMIQLLAMFQSSVKGILPEVGNIYELDTSAAQETLGIKFRSPEEALTAMGKSLIDHKLI